MEYIPCVMPNCEREALWTISEPLCYEHQGTLNEWGIVYGMMGECYLCNNEGLLPFCPSCGRMEQSFIFS